MTRCGTPGSKRTAVPGGNVEPVTVGGVPVEGEGGVGLRQVHVAADLNRAVTGVDDLHLDSRSAPALISISPSPNRISPGTTDACGSALLTGSGGGR